MTTLKLKAAFFALASLLIVSGCVETSMMYRGNALSSGQTAKSIQDSKPHEEVMTDFNMNINYRYVRNGDVLNISGRAALTERYPGLYSQIRYLDVYLFFVDENSRVLETVRLGQALTGRLDEVLDFSKSLKIPGAATAISIGYSGEVLPQGGDLGGGGSALFNELPLTK